MAFLFLKEKLRAVLGLGQYYLRDVFQAPHSHIYVAYLPERSIKPHELAPAHQHPTSTFSWSGAVHVLREMHMLQHLRTFALMVLVAHSLCFFLPFLSPSLPPSSSSSLSFSFLTSLHSSPTDPWKPLFGFSAEFFTASEEFQLYMLALHPHLFLFSGKDGIKQMLHLYPRGECFEKE